MASSSVKRSSYQIVDGMKFPVSLPTENIKSGLRYKPKDDDVFVVTYMKSGTTWTQQICTLIFAEGEIPPEMKQKGLFHVSPFLEWVGAEEVAKMPNPKIIKTHLPFKMQPYNPKAKYIYVARNPKDVLVSLCSHYALFSNFKFNDSPHELLPFFISGDISYGSYADHILSWWEHRNDSNVLFLLYEDMKSDIRQTIRKIAVFLGNDYSNKLESNPNILEKIVEQSDISFMKKTTNKDFERLWSRKSVLYSDREFNFVRKGIIGDWKNAFTAEDNMLIEKWFEDSFKNTGVYHLWDNYGVFEHKT